MIAYVSGSYDILHEGHLNFLEQARRIADEHNAKLLVGVNTDGIYLKHKGHKPVNPYEARKRLVEALKVVSSVVPQDIVPTTPILKKHKVDLYIIAREYDNFHKEEIEYMKSIGGKVEFIGRTPNISSTSIKKRLYVK